MNASTALEKHVVGAVGRYLATRHVDRDARGVAFRALVANTPKELVHKFLCMNDDIPIEDREDYFLNTKDVPTDERKRLARKQPPNLPRKRTNYYTIATTPTCVFYDVHNHQQNYTLEQIDSFIRNGPTGVDDPTTLLRSYFLTLMTTVVYDGQANGQTGIPVSLNKLVIVMDSFSGKKGLLKYELTSGGREVHFYCGNPLCPVHHYVKIQGVFNKSVPNAEHRVVEVQISKQLHADSDSRLVTVGRKGLHKHKQCFTSEIVRKDPHRPKPPTASEVLEQYPLSDVTTKNVHYHAMVTALLDRDGPFLELVMAFGELNNVKVIVRPHTALDEGSNDLITAVFFAFPIQEYAAALKPVVEFDAAHGHLERLRFYAGIQQSVFLHSIAAFLGIGGPESGELWSLGFECLQSLYPEKPKLSMLLDRGSGLVKAVKEATAEGEHFEYCVWFHDPLHIGDNFREEVKNNADIYHVHFGLTTEGAKKQFRSSFSAFAVARTLPAGRAIMHHLIDWLYNLTSNEYRETECRKSYQERTFPVFFAGVEKVAPRFAVSYLSQLIDTEYRHRIPNDISFMVDYALKMNIVTTARVEGFFNTILHARSSVLCYAIEEIIYIQLAQELRMKECFDRTQGRTTAKDVIKKRKRAEERAEQGEGSSVNENKLTTEIRRERIVKAGMVGKRTHPELLMLEAHLQRIIEHPRFADTQYFDRGDGNVEIVYFDPDTQKVVHGHVNVLQFTCSCFDPNIKGCKCIDYMILEYKSAQVTNDGTPFLEARYPGSSNLWKGCSYYTYSTYEKMSKAGMVIPDLDALYADGGHFKFDAPVVQQVSRRLDSTKPTFANDLVNHLKGSIVPPAQNEETVWSQSRPPTVAAVKRTLTKAVVFPADKLSVTTFSLAVDELCEQHENHAVLTLGTDGFQTLIDIAANADPVGAFVDHRPDLTTKDGFKHIVVTSVGHSDNRSEFRLLAVTLPELTTDFRIIVKFYSNFVLALDYETVRALRVFVLLELHQRRGSSEDEMREALEQFVKGDDSLIPTRLIRINPRDMACTDGVDVLLLLEIVLRADPSKIRNFATLDLTSTVNVWFSPAEKILRTRVLVQKWSSEGKDSLPSLIDQPFFPSLEDAAAIMEAHGSPHNSQEIAAASAVAAPPNPSSQQLDALYSAVNTLIAMEVKEKVVLPEAVSDEALGLIASEAQTSFLRSSYKTPRTFATSVLKLEEAEMQSKVLKFLQSRVFIRCIFLHMDLDAMDTFDTEEITSRLDTHDFIFVLARGFVNVSRNIDVERCEHRMHSLTVLQPIRSSGVVSVKFYLAHPRCDVFERLQNYYTLLLNAIGDLDSVNRIVCPNDSDTERSLILYGAAVLAVHRAYADVVCPAPFTPPPVSVSRIDLSDYLIELVNYLGTATGYLPQKSVDQLVHLYPMQFGAVVSSRFGSFGRAREQELKSIASQPLTTADALTAQHDRGTVRVTDCDSEKQLSSPDHASRVDAVDSPVVPNAMSTHVAYVNCDEVEDDELPPSTVIDLSSPPRAATGTAGSSTSPTVTIVLNPSSQDKMVLDNAPPGDDGECEILQSPPQDVFVFHMINDALVDRVMTRTLSLLRRKAGVELVQVNDGSTLIQSQLVLQEGRGYFDLHDAYLVVLMLDQRSSDLQRVLVQMFILQQGGENLANLWMELLATICPVPIESTRDDALVIAELEAQKPGASRLLPAYCLYVAVTTLHVVSTAVAYSPPSVDAFVKFVNYAFNWSAPLAEPSALSQVLVALEETSQRRNTTPPEQFIRRFSLDMDGSVGHSALNAVFVLLTTMTNLVQAVTNCPLSVQNCERARTLRSHMVKPRSHDRLEDGMPVQSLRRVRNAFSFTGRSDIISITNTLLQGFSELVGDASYTIWLCGTLSCTQCTSIRNLERICLSLVVSTRTTNPAASLQDAVIALTVPHPITTVCDRQGCGGPCTAQWKIDCADPYLLVQVRRCDDDVMMISNELVLDALLGQRAQEAHVRLPVYSCKVIVCELPHPTTHYETFVKVDGAWWHVKDEQISSARVDEVELVSSSFAVLVLYEHKSEVDAVPHGGRYWIRDDFSMCSAFRPREWWPPMHLDASMQIEVLENLQKTGMSAWVDTFIVDHMCDLVETGHYGACDDLNTVRMNITSTSILVRVRGDISSDFTRRLSEQELSRFKWQELATIRSLMATRPRRIVFSCYKSNHYFTVVADITWDKKHMVVATYLLDSLPCSGTGRTFWNKEHLCVIEDALGAVAARTRMAIVYRSREHVASPRQPNYVDCGVYTALYYDILLHHRGYGVREAFALYSRANVGEDTINVYRRELAALLRFWREYKRASRATGARKVLVATTEDSITIV